MILSITPAQRIDYSSLVDCEAWVLGGGITGLTTAIVLQSAGIQTAIVSDSFEYSSSAKRANPNVPTLHAMASAYPHNLLVKNLDRISDDSQHLFQLLFSACNAGIKKYRLFEVYEHEPAPPPLASRRMSFVTFDGRPSSLKTINPPTRPDADFIWGWRFDTFFADMPIYLPFLMNYFLSMGGVIAHGTVSMPEIFQFCRDRYLINCLGWGARFAAGDKAPATVMRGKQILVPGAPTLNIRDADGLPLAYNYTPPEHIFPRGDGGPEYVHFFPRSDGWVLGQTREPGTMDESGRWSGTTVNCDELLIGDELIPAPILELNESILKTWIGQDIQKRTLIGRHGYRFYRDPTDSGVRIDCEPSEDNLIVHNYGHGGSGITMSWGCALEAVRLLLNQADRRLDETPTYDPLNQAIRKLLRS